MLLGTRVFDRSFTFAVQVHAGGAAQPLYRRDDGLIFVAGGTGDVYTLVIQNRSSRPLEIGATVDLHAAGSRRPANPDNPRLVGRYGTAIIDAWSGDGSAPLIFGRAEHGSDAAGVVSGTGTICVVAYHLELSVPPMSEDDVPGSVVQAALVRAPNRKPLILLIGYGTTEQLRAVRAIPAEAPSEVMAA